MLSPSSEEINLAIQRKSDPVPLSLARLLINSLQASLVLSATYTALSSIENFFVPPSKSQSQTVGRALDSLLPSLAAGWLRVNAASARANEESEI